MFERYIESSEFLPVPLSKNRYKVNVEGVILDTEGTPLQTTLNETGDVVAWMYLWWGWDNYRVAEVVAHTFKPIHVPIVYWNKIHVLFRNGNRTDLHPKNLVWKFPPGLGSEHRSGMAFIPMFSRYVISREGRVFSTVSGMEHKPFFNKKGYAFCYVKPDIGKGTMVGRHRLLCLAWQDYPANVDLMHVDHINGIPGSDDLANLEWVTPWENQFRALKLGLKKGLSEVLVKNLKTGEVKEFPTLPECGKEYGICAACVFARIRNQSHPIYPGYLLFKAKTDTSPWRDVSDEELKEYEAVANQRILVRSLRSGDIYEYATINQAADALGMKYMELNYLLKRAEQPVIKGGLQLRLTSRFSEWRDPDNIPEEIAAGDFGLTVLMRDVRTGEVTEYENAAKCSEAHGWSPLTVAVRLRDKDQTIFGGHYQFKRKCDLSPWKDPSEVKVAQTFRPVKVRDIFTGQEWKFASFKEASRHMGCSFSVCEGRVAGVTKFPFKQYEVKSIDEDWETFGERDMSFFRMAYEKDIAFKGRGYVLTHVETEEVKLFLEVEDVMAFLGCGRSTIAPLAADGRVFRNTWKLAYHFQNTSGPFNQ